MQLSHPLSSIVPALDGRVLEVLAGTTRPLSGREVGRIIGEGSANGVWRALNRLEESGVVCADRRGRAIYYIANRDHLAWPAIESLARLRGELIRRLEAEIAAWSIAPLHASVFGSAARGEADADSDLDLLLVRPDGLDNDALEAWEHQLDVLRDHVVRWTGNRAQTFSIDPARLTEHVRANDPLVRSWLADEIRLAGTPIRDLVEAAS
jgi:predicted nucleotidyltransferase